MQWKTTFQKHKYKAPRNRLDEDISALHQIPNANQPAFFATVLKVFSNAYNFVLLVHSEVKPVEEHQANRTGTQTGR